MSQFNKSTKKSRETISYEGGTVYTKTLENEWVNTLFSYMLNRRNNKFYEDMEDVESRFIYLTEDMIYKYGEQFVGKAAIFARNELGLRSISEVVSAMLNKYPWIGDCNEFSKREFYRKYFRRPDGIGEVFSKIDELGDKRSHALIRGCADYLSNLDAYTLGKYKLNNHKYNMHDIINITHAKSDVIDKFQKGNLEIPETWEIKISTAKTKDEKEQMWLNLVKEGKLGYLALIRNLRNIINCYGVTEDFINTYIVPQIENRNAIKKSLVYPYQIYIAYKSINHQTPLSLVQALSNAFNMSIGNMPKLDGESLIILDVSESMRSSYSGGKLSILETCAVYAAALCLSDNNFNFIKFATDAIKFDEYNKYNVFDVIDEMCENDDCGYGTDILRAFDLIDKHYDRIILFSDMQIMLPSYCDKNHSAKSKLKEVWDKYGKCKLYTFDLGNYATQITNNDDDIKYITVLNDKIFDVINLVESDKSLIDIIKNYNI